MTFPAASVTAMSSLGFTFSLKFTAGRAAARKTLYADAQTTAAVLTEVRLTVRGKITDARNFPIGGAVITARGMAVGWTATHHDGSYVLELRPGSYDILVRKGGYVPGTTEIVGGGGTTTDLSLTLAEANLSSVGSGGAKNGEAAFNGGADATATLSSSAVSRRPTTALRDLALELPGVTLAHPSSSVPDSSFVVRGGTAETRVQIDGHPVSAGATGRWDGSYASPALLDSVELVKGPALSGANAGESAFGTINLRTRDFAPGRSADVTLGGDQFNGRYFTVALSGNVLDRQRLSYVVGHSDYRYFGADAGRVATSVVPAANGTAVVAGEVPLDAPFVLGSDLAKMRWRFSPSTSLTLGYFGLHSDYRQTGGAYATYLGNRTIVGSIPTALGGTILTPPQYAGLIGATIPAYTLAQRASAQTNQPLFEAELRTTIKNDTLLVRPYAGTIYHMVNGQNANNGDPAGGGAWTATTTGPGCSTEFPCYRPVPGSALFREQENDRLRGTTVTLLHPVGEAAFNVSFDERWDETTVGAGNPSIRYDGNPVTLSAYQNAIPPTVARNDDWSATYTRPLTSRLLLFAGDYYTQWSLDYGTILFKPDFSFGRPKLDEVATLGRRSYAHNDPQIGLTWHPHGDTSVRLSAGSAITVPYAQLVSGALTSYGLFSGGQVGFKNPALQPETTFAYNLGVDHRLRDGSVIAADAFDNTVHNVFALRVTPFDGALLGVPAQSPIGHLFATQSTPVNAPLERHYGIEVSLKHAPLLGLGYRVSATLQRAFLDELPATFFTSPSVLVNGKQLDGSTSVPFTQAHGELTYRHHSGVTADLGVDYTGTNNWTNGPAFTVWSSTLRYDWRGRYSACLSVENLFDAQTGTPYAAATGGAGFTSVTYGSAAAGGLPVFGSMPASRFGIAPRTFRLQVEAHLGG